jgi:hypothetical protein
LAALSTAVRIVGRRMGGWGQRLFYQTILAVEWILESLLKGSTARLWWAMMDLTG